MTITKEQYQELLNGLETKKRDNGEKFICRKNELSNEVEEIIKEVTYNINDNTHDFDLTYEILDSALRELSNFDFEDIIQEDFDVLENFDTAASYYTSDRLSYLNAWNEEDIVAHMNGNSISEACAYWYDEQVQNAMAVIINTRIK